MPNTAEILIQAKDRFTQLTQQARTELAGLQEQGKKAGEGLGQAGEHGRKAMEGLHGSARQAHLALHELSDLTGVGLPRAVSTFISHSQLVGPALSAAFSVIAVIGLIDTLREVPEAFDKIVGKITEWDEVEKKAYAQFIQDNRTAVNEAEQLRRKLDEIQAIGKSGSTRQIVEESNIQSAIGRRTTANQELLRQEQSLQELHERRERFNSGRKGMLAEMAKGNPYAEGLPNDDEARDQLNKVRQSLDEGRKQLQDLFVQQKAGAKQLDMDILGETQKRVRAQLEAEQQKLQAFLALQGANAKADYENGQIALTQQLLFDRNLEDARYEGLRHRLEREKGLAEQLRSQDAAAAQAALIDLNARLEAAALEHQRNLLENAQAFNKALHAELPQLDTTTQGLIFAKMQHLPIESPGVAAPSAAPGTLGPEDYEIDAEMKRAKAILTLREAQAKSKFSLLSISGRQELALQQQFENEEYAVLQKSFDERMRLAQQKMLEDPIAGRKAIADVNSERDIAGIEHQKRQLELVTDYQSKFFATFREGSGRIWDDFFNGGQNALQDLGKLAKDVFGSITKSVFQDLFTGLFSRGTSGVGRLVGLPGGSNGGLNVSPGSGLIQHFAGGGLLGGLFGGTALTSAVPGIAVGTSAVGPLAGIAGAGGALAIPGVAAPAGVGAFSSALGLGGGARLLGLGAATIPVIGGIAAGAALLAFHFLGHHTREAQFTRDPHEVERNRSVFFFTGMAEAMDRFTNGVDSFVHKVESVQPGDVVMAGMPQAFQQSNQFRRNMTGILMDDV